MTTPGGVPNLPVGALTLDTLASKLQDMSPGAMKDRASERFPSVMDNSTGLSPASDFTPFGILTSIFSGFNSLVANADPADIDGPEDLPQLVIDFITGLPVVGQFVGILEAILGTYDGDDQTLLGIQQIFAPIRKLLQLFAGIGEGRFPTLDEVVAGVGGILNIPNDILNVVKVLIGGLTGSANPIGDLTSLAQSLFNLPLQVASQLYEGFAGALAAFQAQLTGQQNNPGVAIIDDFAANALSGRQTNVLGTMAISTRGKYLQTVNLAADYMGTTGAPRKPATVKCGASITIGAVMNGVYRTWIHGDATMSNYAALEVFSGFDGDALRIVSGAGPDLVVVQKQFDLGTAKIQAGNTFDIRFDPATNRYVVLRNNADTGLFWPDTTNIVTRSTSKLLTGSVTNGDDRNEDGYYGPGISKRTFYDW